jgi:branched-chain amino acid transport system substrate-binding protein
MINLDHEFKAELGKEAAERLIYRDKVDVFILGVPSGMGVMIGKIAEEAGISMWTLCVNTPAKTQQGFKTVISLPINSDMLGYMGVKYLKYLGENHLSHMPKKVSLLYADTEFNQQNLRGLKKYAPKFGFEVGKTVAYPFPSKDITSFLLKLKAAKPEVLFIIDVGEGVMIERALAVLGWDPLRIGLQSSYMNTALIEALGKRAENLLSIVWFAEDATADAKKFAVKFKAKYGYDADSFAGVAYQNMRAIAAAVEKAGSRDRMAIARASRQLVYTRETGPLVLPMKKIIFDETGQAPMEIHGAPGTQVQGGKFVSMMPPAKNVKFRLRDAWKAEWGK